MTSVEKVQNEIVEELSLFSDWIEKYEYLIELGKDEIIMNFDLSLMTLVIRSPFIKPGQIALTLILNLPSSIASVFVTPIIAHLLAA